MMANNLTVNIETRKWAIYLSFPFWVIQIFFGKRPYIPNWCFSVKT